MPNHVHLIAVPERKEELRIAIGEAHRRYSAMINRHHKWTGHLWQGRFSSFPMDEVYLFSAVKYMEMNSVRANLARDPYAWRWSGAKAHAEGKDDLLVNVSPLLEMVGDWSSFLSEADDEDADTIRHTNGRAAHGEKNHFSTLSNFHKKKATAGKEL